MGQSWPVFLVFSSFRLFYMLKIKLIKAQIECLGFEPGVAGWKVQMNPLSYGGTLKHHDKQLNNNCLLFKSTCSNDLTLGQNRVSLVEEVSQVCCFIKLNRHFLLRSGPHVQVVVMEADSCPEGRGFYSKHQILDGHFSHQL